MTGPTNDGVKHEPVPELMSNPRRILPFWKGAESPKKDTLKKRGPYKVEIVWRNVIAMTVLHGVALYGFYNNVFKAPWWGPMYIYIIGLMVSFGTLCGTHRLWAHRSYKAKLPLRIFLMILQTMALQNDIYEWVRDHRVHHKWSETDADPHNSKRGFFFAHMGWLLCKKHPDVIEKGKTVDMSDVWADPVVRFQRRFYIPLVAFWWGFAPAFVPYYYLGQPIHHCMYALFFAYVWTLHHVWFVNSWAHLYGNQPYDKSINPKDTTFVAIATLGEGYHNYHHAFPWDYSASEFGWRENFNLGTWFIDVMAWLGQAYDLKKVPEEVIERRIQRVGDPKLERKPRHKAWHFFIAFMYMTWMVQLVYYMRLIRWYYFDEVETLAS